MEEALLGFQLRAARERLGQWSSQRRKTYLLRENIDSPLSVDRAIWPRADNDEVQSALFAEYHSPQSVPNGLNVFSIKTLAILEQPSRYDGSFLTGITVINDITNHAQKLRAMHKVNIPNVFSQLVNAGWRCLGYDVADYWLKSCLMNCGYNKKEKTILSERFAATLNEFGLFSKVEDAQSFCVACDSRVSEHAPFAVYGLWSNGKP